MEEDLKNRVRSSWREILSQITEPAKKRVNGAQSFVCPLCGHGKNGDGITNNPKSKDGNGLKCFGCSFSGDIIDLYKQAKGIETAEAFQQLSEMIGEQQAYISPKKATARKVAANSPKTVSNGDIGKHQNKELKRQNSPTNAVCVDYTEYYYECKRRLQDKHAIDYLNSRGISYETALRLGVGFDPKADPAACPGGNGGKLHPCPRIIFPTTATHYVARSIDPNTPKEYAKLNSKSICDDDKAGIFNLSALYSSAGTPIVFVTEGAFDALAIEEAGGKAIALNSASNANKLIEILTDRETKAELVIALDNDEAGCKAQEVIKDGCRRLNISFSVANINGQYKDPNEALIKNREEFTRKIEEAKQTKPDNTSTYIDTLMLEEINQFKSSTPTGFKNLDDLIGGIYSGLYCIAAISSLGKTTFAAQMADQIAEAGNDVLFFSLEQSRLELITKSIARRTAIMNRSRAVTSLSIRRGLLPIEVKEAAILYKNAVKDRVSIVEGNFKCTVSFIGEYIRRYMARNGVKPIVFIDYLQVLQPDENAGKRASSVKEAIDNTVTELKRLTRELGITIFIISSVNRSNYLTPIDFESLKESGGIEYTCDVIFGLQLECLNDPLFDKTNNIKERRERVKKEKAASPRKIELCCLKNRYGIATFTTSFLYYPEYDLFEPAENTQIITGKKRY